MIVLNITPPSESQKPVPKIIPLSRDAIITRMRFKVIIDFTSNRIKVINPSIFAKPSLTPGTGIGKEGSNICIKILIASNIVIKVSRRV